MSTLRVKSLKKNIISMYVLQAINYLSPYIILYLAVSALTLEEYGYVAICYGITQVFVSILDIGYNLYLTNIVARSKKNNKKISAIVANAIVLKLLASVVFLISISLIVSIIDFRLASSSIIIVAITATLLSAQPIWYFQGIENMKLVLVTTGLTKLCAVLAVVVWALYIKGLKYLLLIEMISAGLLLISLSMIAAKKLQIKFIESVNKKRLRVIFFESMKFYFPRLAAAAYTATGTTIVGISGEMKLVATYSIAERMYAAMQQAFFPAVQALYPYLSANKDLTTFIKWGKLLLLTSLIASVVLFVFGDVLALIIFPSVGVPNEDVLSILSVALFVYVCNILMGYPLSAMLGNLQVANRSVYYGALMYLIIIFVLVLCKAVTPISVAMTYLVAEIVVCGFRFKRNLERYKEIGV